MGTISPLLAFRIMYVTQAFVCFCLGFKLFYDKAKKSERFMGFPQDERILYGVTFLFPVVAGVCADTANNKMMAKSSTWMVSIAALLFWAMVNVKGCLCLKTLGTYSFLCALGLFALNTYEFKENYFAESVAVPVSVSILSRMGLQDINDVRCGRKAVLLQMKIYPANLMQVFQECVFPENAKFDAGRYRECNFIAGNDAICSPVDIFVF